MAARSLLPSRVKLAPSGRRGPCACLMRTKWRQCAPCPRLAAAPAGRGSCVCSWYARSRALCIDRSISGCIFVACPELAMHGSLLPAFLASSLKRRSERKKDRLACRWKSTVHRQRHQRLHSLWLALGWPCMVHYCSILALALERAF